MPIVRLATPSSAVAVTTPTNAGCGQTGRALPRSVPPLCRQARFDFLRATVLVRSETSSPDGLIPAASNIAVVARVTD